MRNHRSSKWTAVSTTRLLGPRSRDEQKRLTTAVDDVLVCSSAKDTADDCSCQFIAAMSSNIPATKGIFNIFSVHVRCQKVWVTRFTVTILVRRSTRSAVFNGNPLARDFTVDFRYSVWQKLVSATQVSQRRARNRTRILSKLKQFHGCPTRSNAVSLKDSNLDFGFGYNKNNPFRFRIHLSPFPKRRRSVRVEELCSWWRAVSCASRQIWTEKQMAVPTADKFKFKCREIFLSFTTATCLHVANEPKPNSCLQNNAHKQ